MKSDRLMRIIRISNGSEQWRGSKQPSKNHRTPNPVLLICAATILAGCAAGQKSATTPDNNDLRTGVCRDAACHITPEIVVCTRDLPAGDHCEIHGDGSTIILQGDVLALDKTYQNGMVAVDSTTGRITYAGCGTDYHTNGNETVISCGNAVISPGLVNGHEHLTYSNAAPASWGVERFNHRHDWRLGLNGHTAVQSLKTTHNEVVELRALMSGTTAVFGSGKVDGLIRNLDEEAIDGVQPVYQTFPLGDATKSTYSDTGCDYSYHETVTQFDDSCPYGPHIAEGVNSAAHNELYCLNTADGGYDIFKPNLAIVHGVAVTSDNIDRMARNNVKLIWSPRTNLSLYGDTAPVTEYDRMGITIGLGTDWIYSGSANMLRELACVDELNRSYYNHYFSDYQIWQMPTIGTAAALGVSASIGRLAPGFLADIAVYRKSSADSPYRSVIEARNQDVLLVMINGKRLYGDANLIPEGETIHVCGEDKKIDTKAAGIESLADLSQHAGYPLFFCDTPPNEPSCIPQRTRTEDTQPYQSSVYSGKTETDRDGDGVEDPLDNCPDVFNPIRPMDGNHKQSDDDHDGIGDACDPFPMCSQNDDTCVTYSSDHDGDGIHDYFDNCPNSANADQKDTDGDNIGDLCDRCDDRYDRDGDTIADNCDKCPDDGNNEDSFGCPLVLKPLLEIRKSLANGTFTPGRAKVRGTITAIAGNGYFIQDREESGAGLYIYDNTSKYPRTHSDGSIAELIEGKQFEIKGSLTMYYGFVELTDITDVVEVNSEGTPIEPSIVTAAQIQQDSNDKVSHNKLDSTLVVAKRLKIQSFSESRKNNYAIAVDTDGNTVYIDDFIMGKQKLFESLAAGSRYDITGIIVYDYGMSKLAPRTPGDIQSIE